MRFILWQQWLALLHKVVKVWQWATLKWLILLFHVILPSCLLNKSLAIKQMAESSKMSLSHFGKNVCKNANYLKHVYCLQQIAKDCFLFCFVFQQRIIIRKSTWRVILMSPPVFMAESTVALLRWIQMKLNRVSDELEKPPRILFF